MTVDEMRSAKRKLKITNQELAERSGLPVSTVSKILSGITKHPHEYTMNALENILRAGLEPDRVSIPGSGSEALFVHDISYPYGTSAERKTERTLYTLEDYLKMPPERHAELIDGRLYDQAGPTGIHQRIVMKIWKQLDTCIEEHQMACIAQAAPFDVLLDSDIYTVVQPDVMVFCRDPRQALETRAQTAPDFICEVLSASTAFRDRHLKLYKYRAAGVSEVWLADPENQSVEVYDFASGEEMPRLYSFQDKVPVRLFRGKCTVDFVLIGKDLGTWL